MTTTYPVRQIEPFWRVKRGGDWVEVDSVVETESLDGKTGRVILGFREGSSLPYDRDELIEAQPPDERR
jgi:hypothetical protein